MKDSFDYVCYLYNKIESILDIQIPASCSICGKKLDIGDFLDIHYPYFNNYNRCKNCYEHEYKGKNPVLRIVK